MIPVILDTDLGTDIDDHWAVAMILGCPELDVRLITTASGDTTYRAQLLAGILSAAGRTDIPIGIGPATALPEGIPVQTIPAGAAAMPLSAYEGIAHEDGVAAIIDTIMASPEPVTLIAIGPLTNVAAAVVREPAITSRSRVISMAAYLRGGVFSGVDGPQKEYNVILDVPAFRTLLASEWDLTLTPVDSCGDIELQGERFARIRDSRSPLLQLVMRDYREWWGEFPTASTVISSPEELTSVLFDTLAVYLAYRHDAADIVDLALVVDEDGVVAEAPEGRTAHVAIGWRDYDGFLDHLVERLEAAAEASSMSEVARG